MLTWAEQITSVADAVTDAAAFGEPVTLPTGPAQGILSVPGVSAELRERGSRSGAAVRIDQQVQPTLWLRTADAEGLAEGDPVTARDAVTGLETLYEVVSLEPDGHGLTAVALYQPSPQNAAAQARTWR